MSRPARTDATILVASNSTSDAELVKKLLKKEFEKVLISTNPDKAVEDFERSPPEVMVLAFDTLVKSERYYLELYRRSQKIHLQPHRGCKPKPPKIPSRQIEVDPTTVLCAPATTSCSSRTIDSLPCCTPPRRPIPTSANFSNSPRLM